MKQYGIKTKSSFLCVVVIAVFCSGCVAFPGRKLRDVPPLVAGVLKRESPISYEIGSTSSKALPGLAGYASHPGAYTDALYCALLEAGAQARSSAPSPYHLQVTLSIEARNAVCEGVHSFLSVYSCFVIPYYSRHSYVLDGTLLHDGQPVRHYRYAENLHYWGSIVFANTPPAKDPVLLIAGRLAAALVSDVLKDLTADQRTARQKIRPRIASMK